jgi:hypothetical protein
VDERIENRETGKREEAKTDDSVGNIETARDR